MFRGTFRAVALTGLTTLAACNGSGSGSHKSSTTAGASSMRTTDKQWYGPGSTGVGGTPGYGGGATGLGNFAAGPDLNKERGQHTACLLKDGRVLVTGGMDGQAILASSEIFDPAANTWTDVTTLSPTPDQGRMMVSDPNGDFASVRRHHTAVTLIDGRVLVAGGHGVERRPGGRPAIEALKSAYLFDPSNHTFSAVPPLTENRFMHQAAALTDGRAVVEGGVGLPTPQVLSLTTLELYDPVQNRWTVQQVSPRTNGVGVTVPGKGAFFYGGGDIIDYVGQNLRALVVMNFNGQPSEMFKAPLDVIAPGPQSTFPGPRMDVGGCMTTSQFAFFAGGRVENPNNRPPLVLDPSQVYDVTYGTPTLQVVDTTEKWDVATNAFLPGPKLNTKRWGARCVEIGMTSDVLIVGGVDEANQLLTSCELYSVRYDAIIGTVDMNTARHQFQALTLQDGRVMVIGGLDDQLVGLTSCEFHVR